MSSLTMKEKNSIKAQFMLSNMGILLKSQQSKTSWIGQKSKNIIRVMKIA